jgi:hypothetical protein
MCSRCQPRKAALLPVVSPALVALENRIELDVLLRHRPLSIALDGARDGAPGPSHEHQAKEGPGLGSKPGAVNESGVPHRAGPVLTGRRGTSERSRTTTMRRSGLTTSAPARYSPSHRGRTRQEQRRSRATVLRRALHRDRRQDRSGHLLSKRGSGPRSRRAVGVGMSQENVEAGPPGDRCAQWKLLPLHARASVIAGCAEAQTHVAV